MPLAARTSHLRLRHGHSRVTFVELFFDLVFVFAVTQLSHGLLEHLTPLGALQTAILMLALWWAWIDNAWLTNWLDPERAPVRILLFALMLLGLVVSASIPKAFAERALPFALAYAALEILPKLFMLWALKRHDAGNHRNFLRITVWRALGAACWLAGGFVAGTGAPCAVGACARDRHRVAPVRLLGAGARPLDHRRLERRGRPHGRALRPVRHHRARRIDPDHRPDLRRARLDRGDACGLRQRLRGSVAMWVVYFNIGAERSSRTVAASTDPGRLARSGYTYLHIPIVAGIIVAAVADELILHHPGGHTDLKTAAVILGGPALYLAGNSLFKWLTAPWAPLSHTVGLGLLGLLIVAVPFVPPLALSAATTAVLILVAVWEWVSLGRRAGRPPVGH